MKKSQNQFIYIGLYVLAVFLCIAAGLTIMPYSGASEPSVLGYHALCSFSPVSTVICLFAAWNAWLMKEKFK